MVQFDKNPHNPPAFLSDLVTPGAREFLINPCWRSFFKVRLVLELLSFSSFMHGKITFPISLFRKPFIRYLPSLTASMYSKGYVFKCFNQY